MARKSTAVKQKIKVEDIGGVFMYADDPKSLAQWYRDKLGMELAESHCDDAVQYFQVFDHGGGSGARVFAIKTAKSKLAGERNQFAINFRISDFDGLIERLRSKGVAIERIQDDDYGRFGWIKDSEGNPIEFWQAK